MDLENAAKKIHYMYKGIKRLLTKNRSMLL